MLKGVRLMAKYYYSNKRILLSAYLSPKEHELLKKMSKEDEVSMSRFITNLIIKEATRRNLI